MEPTRTVHISKRFSSSRKKEEKGKHTPVHEGGLL